MVDLAKVLRRTLALVVGVALLGVALAVAVPPTLDVTTQHLQVATAAPVEANVTFSAVDSEVSAYERVSTNPGIRRRWSGGMASSVSYFAVVRFRYRVDGETYRSENVAPPGRAAVGTYGVGTRSKARQVVDRYPRGATVTAYYPPGSPGDAFLLRSPADPLLLGFVLVPASLPFVLGTLLVGGGLGLVDPGGTWKSRLGGYLLALFWIGPCLAIWVVGRFLAPSWATLPAAGLAVACYLAILYYAGQMMVLGRTTREAGLLRE